MSSSVRKLRRRWRPIGFVTAAVAALVSLTVIASGTASTQSATASGLAQAKKVLAASNPPSKIPVSFKSKKAFPKNKRIAYVHCGQPSCTNIVNSIKAGIKGLGLKWTLTVIPTTGSAESVKNGWDTLVRNKPSAVFTSGFPRSAYESELQQLKKANVPVFSMFTLDKPGNGLTLSSGGKSDVTTIGTQQAAWIAVKTNGKSHALYVNLPTFEILLPIAAQFKKDFPKFCPKCKVDSMDLPVSSIGSDASARIVSYLRAHTDINYVALGVDSIGIGLPAALKAAGLANKVHIIGEAPSSENLGYIAAGQQAATVAQPFYDIWTAVLYAAALKLSGQSVAPVQNAHFVQYYIYSKAVPKSKDGLAGPVVPGLYAKYKALAK
jgi:ribose transport system substrate-binding protein